MGAKIKYSCRSRAVTMLRGTCGVLLACTIALAAVRTACAELPKSIETVRNPNSELQRPAPALDSAQSDPAPRSQREAVAPPQKQAAAKDAPASRDSLFGDDAPAAPPPKAPPPASRDSLFGDDVPAADKPKPAPKESRDSLFGADAPAAAASTPGSAWRGFVAGEAAYGFRDPAHWTKERLRLELNRQGQFSDGVKWKIGGRFDYDAAYDSTNFYAPQVQQDQRYGFTLRENYLDFSSGDLEVRLGRQHVVWGEVVGFFIADVVSAKDQRENILPEPELEMLRIPQWAARAEYFMKDMKAELLWIPVPSFDEIGKPGIPGVRGAAGADFYPYPIPGPGGTTFLGEVLPTAKLANTNYGARMSALKNGWDLSAFYYHSLDSAPTFYRSVIAAPAPVFVYQARHDRINQFGGTFAKDLGKMVLKGEAVYTDGRQFNVTRIDQPNGLVEQKTLDYVLGLDFSLPADGRLNLQFFQRVFFNHDPDTLQKKYESGVSVLFDAIKLGKNLEGRALLIHSLNRNDWLVRPKVTWAFEKNWRWAVGVDIFGGPPEGFFGRYNNNDRVFTELRYTF